MTKQTRNARFPTGQGSTRRSRVPILPVGLAILAGGLVGVVLHLLVGA